MLYVNVSSFDAPYVYLSESWFSSSSIYLKSNMFTDSANEFGLGLSTGAFLPHLQITCFKWSTKNCSWMKHCSFLGSQLISMDLTTPRSLSWCNSQLIHP